MLSNFARRSMDDTTVPSSAPSPPSFLRSTALISCSLASSRSGVDQREGGYFTPCAFLLLTSTTSSPSSQQPSKLASNSHRIWLPRACRGCSRD
eukprot:469898-Hanusia_phi.AAC.2